MNKAHIRDFMAVKQDDYKEGKVSTTTMCGETDPDMNKLCFAAPEAVYKKTIENFCEKCRNRWIDEAESFGGHKKLLHQFRKLVHKSTNLTRFR